MEHRMAEDSDAEKTEPASDKRLREARESGDIPRSREVATFAVLMTAGAGLWMMGGGLVDKLSQVLKAACRWTASRSTTRTS